MSKWGRWTETEHMQLGFLIKAGFTNREISDQLGKPLTGVQIKANRIYGGNPNYRIKQRKYVHLYRPVLEYYQNHSAKECQQKFSLTAREFKNLLTNAYMKNELNHIRKDNRTKRPWAVKDYLTLLRYAGLKPRAWIGKKLKRGGLEGIRTRLESLNIASKNIQGLTLSQYRNIFQAEPKRYVKTTAGPTRGVHGQSYYKIVLWSDLDEWIKNGEIIAPDIFKIHINTMAIFQKWIWENYEATA